MSRFSRWAPAKIARRIQSRQQHWQQRIFDKPWVPKPMRQGSPPGSAQSLVDAVALNRWNRPYGSEANSFDVYAGGFSSENRAARAIGRTVGTIALIWTGAAAAGGGSGSGAAAAGAEEVGIGYPLAAEAGGSGAGGLLAGPGATSGAASTGIFSSLPSVSAQEVSTAALVWKLLASGNVGGAIDALTGTDWGTTFLGGGGGGGEGGGPRMIGPDEQGDMPRSPVMLIIGGLAVIAGAFFLFRKLKG